jgi:hypothetical protein
MKTITIDEAEYKQMQESIKKLQEQLALLQDINFMEKLQTFVGLYIQTQKNVITYLPITQEVSQKDVQIEAFGMWADRDIDAQSLRKQAWGSRL